jgi:endonuclease-3
VPHDERTPGTRTIHVLVPGVRSCAHAIHAGSARIRHGTSRAGVDATMKRPPRSTGSGSRSPTPRAPRRRTATERARQAVAIETMTAARVDECAALGGPKRGHDVPEMVRRLRAEVKAYADAAMFDLRERGYGTVFQQLVACIISIRTRDEVSLPASIALLERAPTAEAMAALGVRGIARLVASSAFAESKAAQIHAIAERTATEFGGELPADLEVLTSFRGVGPKCANLALGVATGTAGIAVDVHVHRVTNRWGLVAAPTPERTMAALELALPRRYWVEINRLLVPFGKHVCTGVLPKCSRCPVLEYCSQVGVTRCA